MARFWVGGATGFLGSHLVSALLAAGHSVRACSKSGGVTSGVDVLSVDILDRGAVARSAEGCEFAILAAGRVSRDPRDAESLFELHVRGTESALQGLRDAGVKRVVCASTSGTRAVGNDPKRIYDEEAREPLEYIARWPYYRSKLFGERAALALCRPGEFDVMIVNPSLLLGPGDLHGSSTDDIRLFLEQRIVAIPRGGLSFVDVRDVGPVMIAAAIRGRAGEAYLVTAQNLSVEAFFERLARLSGVPTPTLKLPRHAIVARETTRMFNRLVKSWGGKPAVDEHTVELAQYYWYCDASKAVRELDFAPRDPAVTLRDTIIDLVDRRVALPRVGHFVSASA